jgi:hypothetical protein
MNIPGEVIELADKRTLARNNKDFVQSDQLRDQILELGFIIKDSASGYDLTAKPVFEVFENLADIRYKTSISRKTTICLLIDGWLIDTKECINALIEFMPAEMTILALDLGNKEEVGKYLEETKNDKLEVIHVAKSLNEVGWANAINKLIELNPAPFSAVMDISSIISGDVFTPLIQKITGDVAAVGWKGSLVDLEEQWRSVSDKGDGEVDILLGYLFIIDTLIAQKIKANPKAKFYRNADLEWSLMLRKAGHKLVAYSENLAVEQKRHHAYHDSDVEYREQQSKKNYDRILQEFRGKEQILSPRR